MFLFSTRKIILRKNIVNIAIGDFYTQNMLLSPSEMKQKVPKKYK